LSLFVDTSVGLSRFGTFRLLNYDALFAERCIRPDLTMLSTDNEFKYVARPLPFEALASATRRSREDGEEPGMQPSPSSAASILREAAQLPDNGTGARPIGYSGVR
jgi:hypothetical protein